MFTFTSGTESVTADIVTTYEGETESTAVVLEPVSGDPIVVFPHEQRTRPRTGTLVAALNTWEDARRLLSLLALEHGDTVTLERSAGAGGGAGVDPLEFLPQRVRHRVLPDELDMHEVTVEWTRIGGTY